MVSGLDMSEYLALADSWDYLAMAAVAVSLFLLLYGIKVLKQANSDAVDENKLRMRAYGALVAGLAYIVCSYLAKV